MNKLPVINNNDIQKEISFDSIKNYISSIYMDNNSTTIVDEEAIVAMIKTMEINYANPSGTHDAGIVARQQIELSRKYVAEFIGCEPEKIIFSSGGTESLNSAINSVLNLSGTRNHVITCLTEHNAVLNKIKKLNSNIIKYKISYLEVDNNGNFKLDQLNKLLSQDSNVNLLVSLMAANNETGTIHNNIFEAINLSHKHGAIFNLDAVQIAGKLPLKPYIEAGVDFLSISGHKMHAPKGVGALYIKDTSSFFQTIIGGMQENGFRAGTENVPGIVAFGVVAKKMPLVTDKTIELHSKFIEKLLLSLPSCIINGGGVPGTINVGFKYVHREAMIARLSDKNLYASIGSACAKGIEPSHVLSAMNVPLEYINGSVRFSFSKYTTELEVDRAIKIIEDTYNELRAISIGVMPS